MNVDEIIDKLADNERQTNDCRYKAAYWEANVTRMERELSECHRMLRNFEDSVLDLKKKRVELLAQLKVMLCGEPQEVPGKQADEKTQPATTKTVVSLWK